MEKWRRVWREGFVPQLSSHSLEVLRDALMNDDPRLVQGITCYPPLLQAMKERAIEAACVLGWCAWQGEGVQRVDAIEEYFQKLCDTADAQFPEPAACRFFLNWYDDTPRDEMRPLLLEEVLWALQQRQSRAA